MHFRNVLLKFYLTRSYKQKEVFVSHGKIHDENYTFYIAFDSFPLRSHEHHNLNCISGKFSIMEYIVGRCSALFVLLFLFFVYYRVIVPSIYFVRRDDGSFDQSL